MVEVTQVSKLQTMLKKEKKVNSKLSADKLKLEFNLAAQDRVIEDLETKI